MFTLLLCAISDSEPPILSVSMAVTMRSLIGRCISNAGGVNGCKGNVDAEGVIMGGGIINGCGRRSPVESF
jgi:hypothetical protein